MEHLLRLAVSVQGACLGDATSLLAKTDLPRFVAPGVGSHQLSDRVECHGKVLSYHVPANLRSIASNFRARSL